MAEGGDLHEDVVAARLEVDFHVDGPAHQVAALTAYNVVVRSFLLDPEFKHKVIFSGQAFEVAGVKLNMSVVSIPQEGNQAYLRKDNYQRTLLLQVNQKFGAMVICRPRDIQRGPLLSDCPLWAEKARAVQMLVFLEKIIIRNPEKLFAISQYMQRLS